MQIAVIQLIQEGEYRGKTPKQQWNPTADFTRIFAKIKYK